MFAKGFCGMLVVWPMSHPVAFELPYNTKIHFDMVYWQKNVSPACPQHPLEKLCSSELVWNWAPSNDIWDLCDQHIVIVVILVFALFMSTLKVRFHFWGSAVSSIFSYELMQSKIIQIKSPVLGYWCSCNWSKDLTEKLQFLPDLVAQQCVEETHEIKWCILRQTALGYFFFLPEINTGTYDRITGKDLKGEDWLFWSLAH